MASKKLENATAAEAYLTVMKDRGVDYLFANAGTSRIVAHTGAGGSGA